MARPIYEAQVRLLVSTLPLVAEEPCFALKGGTAINLFVRDLPRLSVDIDLTYLPLEERGVALPNARAALQRIGRRVAEATGARVDLMENRGEGLLLYVERAKARIKVEVNPVLRGCLKPPKSMDIRDLAEDEFGFARMPVLDLADLYGGKICAALDRQHPRDLFDVKLLLDEDGPTRDVIEGFLVYLISHRRPIRELLAPRLADIRETFINQFQGMTREPVQVEELEHAREELLARLREMLTPADCAFLLSVKRGEPDWSHLPYPHVQELPGVRWKLQNIGKMKPDARQRDLAALEEVLATHYNYGGKE
ncbi:nucleotidyl transferase AbiEii/AbiGii toxin family protein [Spectribacter hydrogenoxidans]|uniref:Nucleotidyl transferase AbiEii/AbiGii toxin family protein n=1 Tax=Spectribacter hydrogenoxidans TaxID=3075608 RepID=A0ABU3C2X5_9GAMM|nr:nucleotidyl transferase AbiEii/AbiGii toxin family protein [Salinisphaera sp. W335]MDT0635898.1 nucleotidyl transferase AbiEii/AbiGii toxin family protein [Salinisphaera sp. W335]